jgi:hypothetical protein
MLLEEKVSTMPKALHAVFGSMPTLETRMHSP